MPEIIPIVYYEQVIAIALQRKLLEGNESPLLSFSDLWRVCEAARLPETEPRVACANERRYFVSKIVEAVRSLEQQGYVWRYSVRSPYPKLVHIGLTEDGKIWLRRVIFSHQERAPSPEQTPPPHRGGGRGVG